MVKFGKTLVKEKKGKKEKFIYSKPTFYKLIATTCFKLKFKKKRFRDFDAYAVDKYIILIVK